MLIYECSHAHNDRPLLIESEAVMSCKEKAVSSCVQIV